MPSGAGGARCRDVRPEPRRPRSTMEGFWSLPRSWLRPHRGISRGKLPLDLGFFEFVHNVRKRGKASLGSLVELLVGPGPRNAG